MKITKVNIHFDEHDFEGLENIQMEKLQNIVLLAGKNGSGKTRILKQIFSHFINKRTKAQHDEVKETIQRVQNELNFYKKGIISYETEFKRDNLKFFLITKQYLIEFEKREKQISSYQTALNKNEIETDILADNYAAINFVPKSLLLDESDEYGPAKLKTISADLDNAGVEKAARAAFSTIQIVHTRYFNATHQNSILNPDESKNAIDDFERLNQIIKIFLDTEITYDKDGCAQLFGLSMSNSNFSDGQKILIQFCVVLFKQEIALSELILILDEPENHLHPAAIIGIIDRITKSVPNGQVWIATHSVPLLAHFDPSLIWYVEKGKIQHAGKIQEKVLHSLLGGEDGIEELKDFINLPAQYATSRYAYQSLFEPQVVFTGSDDKQSIQIRTELINRPSSEAKLKILDYGAGKGRLISNIVDIDENNEQKLIDRIQYIAYDEYDTDKDQCRGVIAKAFGDCKDKYFNNMTTLLSSHDKNSFDIIIMCNVLHEIEPIKWLTLFGQGGEITSLLKDDGVLLLVEDHRIPVGEKAYHNGFLVLDTPQLKELFKITSSDKNFAFSGFDGNNRLKAHQIPKACLTRIDSNSRVNALKSMSNLARTEIRKIRNEGNSYSKGKLHGFWTQQFANAELSLAELTNT